jgi:DNA-binding transcriptional regulator PaaX
MSKYKYYFNQPRSEIAKDVLTWLALSGAVVIAATSPYFIQNLLRSFKNAKKYQKKKISDTFYNLRRQGCVDFEKKNNQIYIHLTDRGRKSVGWLQIDALKIKKSKKWDKKWRIVIFDIAQLRVLYREVFRGKLKELGFCQLQKSVWVCPFDCRDEIKLLKDFLGLTDKEVKLIIAEDIGKDDWLKKTFNLN